MGYKKIILGVLIFSAMLQAVSFISNPQQTYWLEKLLINLAVIGLVLLFPGD